MPYTVPTFESIRSDLLRDLKAQLPEADIGPDSDFYVRATSVASAIEGLYEHQAWLVKQIFPDTADREYLALHAQVRGLKYKSATAASGQISLAGTPGAPIQSGLAFKLGEVSYITTGAGVLDGGGAASIAAQAQAAGIEGNAEAGAKGSLMAPPPGVGSQVVVVTMTGGVDPETDAELLARLLDLIRRPPAGGNRYDYRRWAMEVAGVSAAYVYPLRRGLGTVDVVVTSAGTLPSQETIDAGQDHIDDVRPVTAKNCVVLAPTQHLVNVTVAVALNGLTLTAAQAQVIDALNTYFDQLTPGETAYRSRIEALISGLSGVVDRAVTLPIANVVPTVDANVVEWLRLGVVTVTAMP